MPAFVKNLTFDCVDALLVARFWAAALGSDVDEDSTPERAYVWSPSAPPWSNASPTSPSSATPKATSSASNPAPGTRTRPRVGRSMTSTHL